MPLINLSGDTHLVYWRMYLGGSERECEDCRINDAVSPLSEGSSIPHSVC